MDYVEDIPSVVLRLNPLTTEEYNNILLPNHGAGRDVPEYSHNATTKVYFAELCLSIIPYAEKPYNNMEEIINHLKVVMSNFVKWAVQYTYNVRTQMPNIIVGHIDSVALELAGDLFVEMLTIAHDPNVRLLRQIASEIATLNKRDKNYKTLSDSWTDLMNTYRISFYINIGNRIKRWLMIINFIAILLNYGFRSLHRHACDAITPPESL
jgi:hypothetical protein